MAIFVTSVQMGPVFGPLVSESSYCIESLVLILQIGGFVTEKRDWPWTQWVMLFGVAIVLAITVFMKETYKPSILKARAKRLGIPGPVEPQRTRAEFFAYFAGKTLVRPIKMLLTEPIVTLFDIYTAFTFGLLNAFFAAFSYVFEHTYRFNLGSTGLTYLGQAVGSIFGLAIILYFSQYRWAVETKKLVEADPEARYPPERKLIIAKIGAPLLPLS